MISLTHFWEKSNGQTIIIVALETLPCPLCNGELFTRSTCRRKAITSSGETKLFQLRVRKCRNCKRTHRELPKPLVPYKRYDGEAITDIRDHPETAPCSDRTILLTLRWLEWFIPYANHIRESLQLILSVPLSKTPGKTGPDELALLVRLVANSGNWLHNRSCFI